MRDRGIRDDVAPWSFFLPVTLAVIVGVLAAGLVQRGIDIVFADGDRDRAEAMAPVESAAAVEAPAAPAADAEREPGPALREAPAAPVPNAAVAASAPAAPSATAATQPLQADADAASIPALPGAIVARREGAPEACINGTIATRDANGWQQRLEDDAPVPCTEQSSAPR